MATASIQITRRLIQTTLTGEVLELKRRCGNVCKNARRFKIRQSRTTCERGEKQTQRIVETLSEMQEDFSQEAPHSTGDLAASVLPQSHRKDFFSTTQPMREKVKWPPANDNIAWNQLDQDLNRVLEATLAGTAERKLTA